MTEIRKAQLDAFAEHFGFEPRGIYLLAGEVLNVIEYVPRLSELKSLPRKRRDHVAGKWHASPNRNLLKSLDVNLDLVDVL